MLHLPAEVALDYPSLAFSPDGGRLYFTALGPTGRQVFERRLDGWDIRALPGSEHGMQQTVSPDGRWVVFRASPDGGLRQSPVGDGAPQMLDREAAWGGASWAPDGTLFYSRSYNSGLRCCRWTPADARPC